jgi:zona occludens toxin (predicted ATPase)
LTNIKGSTKLETSASVILVKKDDEYRIIKNRNSKSGNLINNYKKYLFSQDDKTLIIDEKGYVLTKNYVNENEKMIIK